jgi:hypothetical protein
VAWAGRQEDRHSTIAVCRDRLRAHRDAANVSAPSQVSITERQLFAFLAGFVTAEAHFGATQEGHPFFTINLRNDDRALLSLFRDRLRLGRLVDVPPYRGSQAAISWRIGRLDELRELTCHLDGYSPRGRVLGVYEAWRELVLLEERRTGRRRALARCVKERRAYQPGLELVTRRDALAERRARHIAVLQSWAASAPECLTATTYARWRRESARDAPTRNTLAASFGSWSAALTAAGLSTIGCRSAEAIARTSARAASEKPARMAAHRSAILEAVRECTRVLGRTPGAVEFFRWRNVSAPDTPCQATVYRAFPGGWASVVAASQA